MNALISLSPQNRRRLALAVASGAALMMATPASAELSPALDRFSISAGAFQAEPEFNATVSTGSGKFQSGDIKPGKETMPRVKADIMIFDSQGLSFDYYRFDRGYAGGLGSNGSTTLGNANLDLKLEFAKLSYKWWIGSGNTVLGLGAGAAYYKVGLDANASRFINGTNVGISEGYSDDAVAPLLEIGLRHAISPDLRFFADASGVQKSGGSLNGNIYNAAVGVEWFPVKNVGVVFDYSMSQTDLSRSGSDDSKLKVKLQGPSAFVKVRF